MHVTFCKARHFFCFWFGYFVLLQRRFQAAWNSPISPVDGGQTLLIVAPFSIRHITNDTTEQWMIVLSRYLLLSVQETQHYYCCSPSLPGFSHNPNKKYACEVNLGVDCGCVRECEWLLCLVCSCGPVMNWRWVQAVSPPSPHDS